MFASAFRSRRRCSSSRGNDFDAPAKAIFSNSEEPKTSPNGEDRSEQAAEKKRLLLVGFLRAAMRDHAICPQRKRPVEVVFVVD